MSRAQPASPRLLRRQLWLGTQVIVDTCLALAGSLACLSPLGGNDRRPLLRFFLVLFVLAALEAFWSAQRAMQRLAPLHRQPDAEPSEAAIKTWLRDAYRLPLRSAVVGSAWLLLWIGLDTWQGWTATRLPPRQRLVIGLLAAAAVSMAAPYRHRRWQEILAAWLSITPRLHPPIAFSHSLAARLEAQLMLPLLAMFAVGSAVWLHYQAAGPAQWAALALSGALLTLAASRSTRLARTLADDLRALKLRARSLVRRGDPLYAKESTAALLRPFRIAAAANLSRAMQELTQRYAELASDEARACQVIEETQQIKARLMACMSHDLRSPLNAIQGFAELLRNGGEGPLVDNQRESIEVIRSAGTELLLLIDRILDWTKAELGKLSLEKRRIRCPELLAGARAALHEALAGSSAFRLTVECDETLPWLHVDTARIEQALTIVVLHLAKHQRGETCYRLVAHATRNPPSSLERTSRSDDGCLHIDVIAEPAPLSMHERHKLSDVFAADRLPNEVPVDEVGLGLALAHALLTAHRGKLRFVGRSLEEANFRLSIPISPT